MLDVLFFLHQFFDFLTEFNSRAYNLNGIYTNSGLKSFQQSRIGKIETLDVSLFPGFLKKISYYEW